MKKYTVGLIFDKGLEKVLLVEKTHPEWQKGKLNGPGGKIEEGESPIQCVVREIKEEVNLDVPESQWKQVAIMKDGPAAEITFFVAQYDGALSDAVAMTEEKIFWLESDNLPANVIGNLKWIVPLCKDVLASNDTPGTKIQEVNIVYG